LAWSGALEDDAMEAFRQQEAAWGYVARISDPKERLLTEIAVAKALAFLATDPEYRRTVSAAQVDLLLYARTVHELFRRADVLKAFSTE
jgi:hypothetical protein